MQSVTCVLRYWKLNVFLHFTTKYIFYDFEEQYILILKKMYAEVDVFISNYTLVDADIFQLWTEGYSCKCTALAFVMCCCSQEYFE